MRIRQAIEDHIKLVKLIESDTDLLDTIQQMADTIVEVYKQGGKVFFCGNGGSAADAQHLSAELSGKFYKERKPLFAEALHVNSSYLTAVANDYDFTEVYARLLEAKGQKGDVLIALTTSAKSQNVIKAAAKAKELGMKTFGWTGENKTTLHELCDATLTLPSSDTPRIQEAHILIGHTICEYVEESLF